MQVVKRRRKLKVYNLVILVCSILLVFSLSMIGYEFYQYHKNQSRFEELATIVEQDQQDNQEFPYLKLDDVFEYNLDMIGWLKLDDTVLNYPVMYTPDNPEYYLRKDFDKNRSNAGTPFLGPNTAFDVNHLIVYGHNMKNGTLFAPLLGYRDITFLEQHPIITYQTKDMYYEYQVFAAFYSRVYYNDELDVFRYYDYYDLSDESTYNEYVELVKHNSLIPNDITPVYGEDIMTLSTCEYSKENGRFVVVARCVKEVKINENSGG